VGVAVGVVVGAAAVIEAVIVIKAVVAVKDKEKDIWDEEALNALFNEII